MISLVDRVRRFIDREALIPPGARVAVAVSGGSDSVALLHVLVALAPAVGFTVAGVAHLNHQLRGGESDGDELFCRDLAARLNLPCAVDHLDVATLAEAHQVSIEVAARRARYRFLARAAGRFEADTIATGHTRDDQAETFLLRVLRGAGATGLASIPPRRASVVRPLLDERRHDLRTWLAERGEPYREDASNADVRIPRNWVRHALLPLLAERVGGDVTDVLAREAALLRDDGALLDDVADEAARRVVTRPGPGQASLRADELVSLPPALARRVVRRALALVSPAFQGARHVEQVLALARGTTGPAQLDLPGVRLERNGGDVVLHNRGPGPRRSAAGFRYALAVPGRTVVPEAGVAIEAEAGSVGPLQASLHEGLRAGQEAFLDAAAAADGLWVRSRRPGDAYRPLGLGGRKKLQDVFVDRKVPRDRRDQVPIVVDARDRIVWVAGFGPSDEARVTPATQSVVTLRVNRLGDLG